MSIEQAPHVLRALDAHGNVSWWTGRAGADWVSRDRSQAFADLNRDGARRRALQFNARRGLHGLLFIAIPAKGDPE